MINNTSIYRKFVDLLEEFKKHIVNHFQENKNDQAEKKELFTDGVKEKLKKIKYSGRRPVGLDEQGVSLHAFSMAHSSWITPSEVYAHAKLPQLRCAILRLSRGNGSVCYVSPEKMVGFYLSDEGKNIFPCHHEALKHFIKML